MTIEHVDSFKIKQEKIPFTMHLNKVLKYLRNAEALGIWVYLTSFSENWKVYRTQLMKHFKIGRDKLISLLKILADKKLIEYVQDRKEDGTFGEHCIMVKAGFDFMPDATDAELSTDSIDESTAPLKIRTPVEPHTGKSAPTKERLITKEKTNTKVCSSGDELSPNRFEDFWKAYPKKQAKQESYTLWKRMKLDGEANQIIESVKNRLLKDRDWLEGYIMQPAKFLRNQRWKDEIGGSVPNSQQAAVVLAKPNELRSTVKEWAPGHPDYDRLHGIK